MLQNYNWSFKMDSWDDKVGERYDSVTQMLDDMKKEEANEKRKEKVEQQRKVTASSALGSQIMGMQNNQV